MGLFRRRHPIESADVTQLQAEITALRQALDEQAGSTQTLHDKLVALDDRITSVSTELANQLTELGHDIDALNAKPTDGVDPEALTAVRDGQVTPRQRAGPLPDRLPRGPRPPGAGAQAAALSS